MPDEHPLRDQIRQRVDELFERQGALIAELEEVATELAALQAAEREFVRGLARKVKLDRLRSDGELKPGGGDGSSPPSEPDPAPTPPAGAEPDLPGGQAPEPSAGKPPPSRAAKTYQRRQALIAFFEANRAGHYSLEGLLDLVPEAGSRATTRRDLDALVAEGKLQHEPRVGWRLKAEGGAEPPQVPPPDPPEGRASPEPPEAPSEPDSAPEPPPSPRSPARAARRRGRRAIQPLPGRERRQPPAPPQGAGNGTASRSDGIEKPPKPARHSAPFKFADGDRKLLEVLAERPLTPEGLAIKVRRPLRDLGPRISALLAAGYLSRGEQGAGNQVYGRTTRPLPV